MPTKKAIYEAEQSFSGRILLYPEGIFYKAYERSAYFLCTLLRQMKVS